jgi:DNA repair protein RecO (recombination protein O)
VFGQGLQSWRCPVCGNDKVTGILDIMSGGLLCDDCKDRARHPMILSDDMVYILQYINGAEIGKLFNFNVQESQLEKLESICRSFMDTYVDKKFNSAEIIASLS